MKKLIIAALLTFATQASAVVVDLNGSANATKNVDMLDSYGKGVKAVEAKALRRAELQDQISASRLKIAAFEVEIAKEKLNKTLAEAALVQMEKN